MHNRKRLQTVFLFFLIALFFFVLTVASALADFSEDQTGTVTIQSDETWRYRRTEESSWNNIGFSDGHWGNVVAPSNGTCGPTMRPVPQIAKPMWAPDPQQGEGVFFRKKFVLAGPVTNALLKTVFDDDGDIYVNGTLVRRDRSGSVNQTVFENEIGSALREGENVIGLYVIDTSAGCQSAQVMANLEITYETLMLDVPIFKQSNPLWKDNAYAGGIKDALDCGTTLESCGCVTTSVAMLLKYHGATKAPNGADTSPQTLNEYFKKDQKCSSKGCISRGYAFGALRWAAIDQYTAEAHKKFGTQKVEWLDRTAASTSSIKSEIRSDNPTVIRSQDGSHWVLARGIKDNVIMINDPYFERVSLDDPAYGSKASAMSRFRKTNSDFRIVQVIAPIGVQILVVDESGRRTGYDFTTGTELEEIPSSSYTFEPALLHPEASQQSPEKTVAMVTIQAPNDGQFKIDITPDLGSSEYIAAVYASNSAGDLEFELLEGDISSNKEKTIIEYSGEKTGNILDINPTRNVIGDQSAIDIFPNKTANTLICTKLNVNIPVAIFSSSVFDATRIDYPTVRFEGAFVRKKAMRDVNRDGRKDVVLTFRLKDTNLTCNSIIGRISGTTKDGSMFRGYDILNMKTKQR